MLFIGYIGYFYLTIILTASAVIFCIIYLYMINHKTDSFRENLKLNDPVRVYHGEEKCYGRIIHINGQKYTIEYFDPNGHSRTDDFLIQELYPTW
jgi:hypothetical protein